MKRHDANGTHELKVIQVFEESGDPDLPPERLAVDMRQAEALVRDQPGIPKGPSKDAYSVAMNMVYFALDYERQKISRTNYPEKIREFVRLWGHNTENIPYCAMGVAYCASLGWSKTDPYFDYRQDPPGVIANLRKQVLPALRRDHFTPHPACEEMRRKAAAKPAGAVGSWIPREAKIRAVRPKRGWLVFFSWPKRAKNGRLIRDGKANHIGIVLSVAANDPHKIETVEFNTRRPGALNGSERNGGAVAKRMRDDEDIIGYIKTY